MLQYLDSDVSNFLMKLLIGEQNLQYFDFNGIENFRIFGMGRYVLPWRDSVESIVDIKCETVKKICANH